MNKKMPNKRPRYHFFVSSTNGSGKSLLSLPGQTFGRIPVPVGVLVKDAKGSHEVEKARRKSYIGEVFFTTSLRSLGCTLAALDMHPLAGAGDAGFPDAEEEFRNLTQ